MTSPNILILCTDQQRLDSLGAFGNEFVNTPVLDALARDGVSFGNCYVQSSVCAPSRASLMTGKYPRNHGLWANGVDIRPHERLFTRALADRGYDCALVGKFHLGSAQHGRVEPRIDDGFRIFRWAHDPYVRSTGNSYHAWLEQNFPGVLDAALAAGEEAIDQVPVEQHFTHWVAEEAIEYITKTRAPDSPFCLLANFFDPHHAFAAPEEFRRQYDADQLPPPVTYDGELTSKPPIYTEAAAASYNGAQRGYLDYSPEELKDAKAQYYAMVSLLDHEIGRILSALELAGLREETIIIFTSDHGELLGDHQLMLKGPMMYECSVKVPLIVRWPERGAAGVRHDGLVQWIDLAPTIAEACDLGSVSTHQGTSLVPILTGESSDPLRDWALSEYRDSCFPYDPPVHTTMLRWNNWKIVVHHGAPSTARARTGELYDLSADPLELENLWDRADFRDVRADLESRLLDTLVATEDRSGARLGTF